MNVDAFSEWMGSLPAPGRIRALALIYSSLTVSSRELFLPGKTAGKEHRVLDMLHGINEIHHTLANQLSAWIHGEEGYSVRALGLQLLEIADQYRLDGFLTTAVEFARTRNL